MIIHIATSNEGKFREMYKMLNPLGHSVVKESLSYPEIQTDTLRDVVDFGIQWILENNKRDWLDDPEHGILLDDSGLFIRSLKDFPGVYSKYVFFSIGTSGILRLMSAKEKEREATFITELLFLNKRSRHFFQGISHGQIALEERGSHGFGYDPIFIPQGSDLTFAEMDTEMKNRYSHRGEAVRKFIDFLQSNEQ